MNTAALETELHVFKQGFQEKASHFNNILKILKETPPETREILLLFPNVITIIHFFFINPATSTTLKRVVARK